MTKAFLLQADSVAIPLADQSVDFVFTSCPYGPQRTYGIGAQRGVIAWVDWMMGCVREMCRVCKGLVLLNCAGWTTKRIYQPGPEMLLSEWFRAGGVCWRPAYWNRVGIPGSGGKQWLRADMEYVLAFKATAEWLEWSDNTANGHPPKWGPGGEMSSRLANGARVNQWGRVAGHGGAGAKNADGSLKASGRPSHRINQWGHSIASGGTGGPIDDHTCAAYRPSHKFMSMTSRGSNGQRKLQGGRSHTKAQVDETEEEQVYLPPTLANPGNLVRGIPVGGGLLGSKLAHENEAPFPEKLAEWFIKSWCKPGGIVLDAFSGSGTTVSVARRLDRVGIGIDLRFNQCQLGARRLAEVPKKEKLVKKKSDLAASSDPFESGLFGGLK